jgi:molecular chaperone GrpE
MIETQESRFNLDRTPDAASPGAVGPTSVPEPQADRLEAQRIAFEKDRKRERKEMADHELRAREEILSDFLEVADNLERAIASWNDGAKHDVKSVQDGVDMVLHLFRSKLERYSVTALDAKGKAFDPYVHHAVSQLPTTDAIPGTVLQQVQKGYWMGERLLRPAMVVVATAPPAAASETSASDEEHGTCGESAADWHGYQRNRR